VESACSTDVAYAGVPPAPGARYVWKVRACDERGLVSDWSEPAAFEVELDGTAGWHASWIGQGRTGTWPPGTPACIPSGQAADVRDNAGRPPASLARIPGARDVQEAVFRVGSGGHEFSGPALHG
jgi:hypothetical protein